MVENFTSFSFIKSEMCMTEVSECYNTEENQHPWVIQLSLLFKRLYWEYNELNEFVMKFYKWLRLLVIVNLHHHRFHNRMAHREHWPLLQMYGHDDGHWMDANDYWKMLKNNNYKYWSNPRSLWCLYGFTSSKLSG
jgi:hypothetical protein